MENKIITDQLLDCKNLACPMPVVQTKKALERMQPGEVLEVQATDKGSIADLQSWAKRTGHQYIGLKEVDGVYCHFLRKASVEEEKEEMKFPHTISNEELQQRIESGSPSIQVLDVREPAEYAFARIPGAISIPLGQLEKMMDQLDPQQEYAVICRSGNRSDLACQMLAAKGFDKVKNVLPGMSAWQGATEKD